MLNNNSLKNNYVTGFLSKPVTFIKFISLLILSFSSSVGISQSYFVLDSLPNEHWSTVFATKDDLYIVYVNYDDCVNCNIALHLFNKENKDFSNTYYLFEGVPDFKIPALKKQLGLVDSIKIITDEKIKDLIVKKFTKVGERSTVLKYSNSPYVLYTSLKSLADYKLLVPFLSKGKKTDNEVRIKDDDYFYTQLNDFYKFNDHYLAITAPANELLLLDSNLNALKKFTIDTSYLRDSIFPLFIIQFPDSVQKINPFETVLRNYREDILPLGMGIYTFNNIDFRNNKIVLSAYVSLPVLVNPNKIRFEGRGFIFELNEDLSIVKLNGYSFDIVGLKYYPLSMYGFGAKEKSENSFNIALTNNDVRYNDTVYKYSDTVFFVAEYSVGTDKFYKSTENRFFIEEKRIREYLAIHQDLAIKHKYINDSLLYFRYMPFIFNLKNNSLIEILQPNTLKKTRKLHQYNNYYSFINPITGNLNTIEHINGKIYLSSFDATMKRSKLMPLDISFSGSPIFFVEGNTLNYVYTQSKKGSFIAKYNLATFSY